MDKKEIQEKLAQIREAKAKNGFPRQKDSVPGRRKATGTNARGNAVAGNRKVGSGD